MIVNRILILLMHVATSSFFTNQAVSATASVNYQSALGDQFTEILAEQLNLPKNLTVSPSPALIDKRKRLRLKIQGDHNESVTENRSFEGHELKYTDLQASHPLNVGKISYSCLTEIQLSPSNRRFYLCMEQLPRQSQALDKSNHDKTLIVEKFKTTIKRSNRTGSQASKYRVIRRIQVNVSLERNGNQPKLTLHSFQID